MSTRGPGAVVIGGTANGVGVVRSLGERGIDVAVVVTMPQDVAHRSRHAAEHVRAANLASDPDSLVELLESRRDWTGRVVIPTNDHALAALSRHRDRLSARFRIPVPPWEITRGVIEKDRTLRAAVEVGIDVPRSFGPATIDNAGRADLPWPVIVKPRQGHLFVERFGRKLVLARNRDELLRVVGRIGGEDLDCEIMELIPGGDHLHYHVQTYRTSTGRFVGDFGLRKLRQSPPFFGVARAAEPADVSELREPTHALLNRLDWWGVASVCYKRDPRTGRHYLMEINGRCPLSHGLARRAGVDYPYMIYSDLAFGTPDGVRRNQWSGVWLHMHADLLYAATHGRREGLDWKAFWRSYRRPKVDAVWSVRDPLPFVLEWTHTLRKAMNSAERRSMLDRVQRPDDGRRHPGRG